MTKGEKISLALRGHTVSIETRKKIAASLRGDEIPNDPASVVERAVKRREQKRAHEYRYKFVYGAKRYGLKPEQYEAIVLTPCEACGTTPSVPDHDHETGRIRGALCGRCNTALGMVGDDVQRLLRLAEYLQR